MVPTNGKNNDAAAAQPTSIGSSIRRRASAYVQKTSASQIATRNRTSSLTARFSPSFEIPKMASGVMKGCSLLGEIPEKPRYWRLALVEEPAQQVADPEEDEDHGRHHQR